MQTGVVGKAVWYEGENWKWMSLVLAFVSGAVLFVLSIREQSSSQRLILQALSVSALMLVMTFALPQRTAESKVPGDFLLEHADKVTPDTHFHIYMLSSIMFPPMHYLKFIYLCSGLSNNNCCQVKCCIICSLLDILLLLV